ncbi:methyltransferase [Pigmentiphaga aceris]|uniref:Methyltransferase n=1 Tax=Pigmentiphaga aceris TaxID=1940612 RepID=A0A5C0B4M5_9BURK|nr:class I SAM-dependent methyltransferase [Pigmentiphaga aceris]QEI08806.1 methyltransferase [Pigmentiphaga aceris]
MRANWSDGYFTEVGYTHGYYRELSPALQRYCLLLRGIAPLQSESPAHCELGFGQGVSINVHAATTPGVFVGTDFNPEQAASAINFAQAAGSQARLYDNSFAELLARDDLPQFDSISLHGIWSWISHENRQIIVEFVKKYLKPGGSLYVSYNCLPGWSHAAPLRHLFAMHDRFVGSSERSATDRVGDAIGFATQLLAAKPKYAAATPGLDERLKQIAGQDRHYLAHEYFNGEWHIGYFTDVVDALADAKVEYAGPAQPIDGMDALHIGSEGIAFLNKITNPTMREQARDYFVNQQFRRDLFVRGARRLSAAERQAALLAQRFALVVPANKVTWTVQVGGGSAELNQAIYKPVVDVLASNAYAPKSLREIVDILESASISAVQATEAVTVLVGMGVVSPCQTDAETSTRRKSAQKLNESLLQHAFYHENIAVLASPVTGGALNVDRISKLFLLARINKHKDIVAFAWSALAASNQRLKKGDTVLQTAEENIADLRDRFQVYEQELLPLLKAHAIF